MKALKWPTSSRRRQSACQMQPEMREGRGLMQYAGPTADDLYGRCSPGIEVLDLAQPALRGFVTSRRQMSYPQTRWQS